MLSRQSKVPILYTVKKKMYFCKCWCRLLSAKYPLSCFNHYCYFNNKHKHSYTTSAKLWENDHWLFQISVLVSLAHNSTDLVSSHNKQLFSVKKDLKSHRTLPAQQWSADKVSDLSGNRTEDKYFPQECVDMKKSNKGELIFYLNFVTFSETQISLCCSVLPDV